MKKISIQHRLIREVKFVSNLNYLTFATKIIYGSMLFIPTQLKSFTITDLS